MKRAVIFFVLSIASISLVLILTYTPETLEALRRFNVRLLLWLVASWLTAIGGYALSFIFMARATESRLAVGPAVQSAFMRILFNLLTPFGFGGGPFVVYYLDHHGVPAGKGSSVVLTQMMIVSVYLFTGAVLGYIHLHDQLIGRPALLTLFVVTGAIQLGGVVAVILVLVYPRAVIKLISWIGRILHRLKLVKDPRRFKRRVIHDGSVARRSFRRYFTHHALSFIAGAAGIAVTYACEVLLMWLVFRSLGHDLPPTDGLAYSALFYLTLSYMPTPGSSGLGEGVFVALFAGVVPRHALGLAVVLWRTFYSYASSITGAVFASHHFTFGLGRRRKRRRDRATRA